MQTIVRGAADAYSGGAAHWDPVPHLDFQFELLYEYIHQSTPTTYLAGASAPALFPNSSSGFEGRILVTRDF